MQASAAKPERLSEEQLRRLAHETLDELIEAAKTTTPFGEILLRIPVQQGRIVAVEDTLTRRRQ